MADPADADPAGAGPVEAGPRRRRRRGRALAEAGIIILVAVLLAGLDADVVTYVVVCDPGDEAVSALTQFACSEHPEAAQVTAVGGFERHRRLV